MNLRIKDTFVRLYTTVTIVGFDGTDHDVTAMLSDLMISNKNELLAKSSVEEGLNKETLTKLVKKYMTELTNNDEENSWMEDLNRYRVQVEMDADLKEGHVNRVSLNFNVTF